ncbi:MAG TPA: Bax inhibitor-1/YccA family protein [Luteibaculaceae bacterium]|nr:Bax inhibitor-1/YccA family protein [Luteibaculaceae bacterium]
MDNYSNFNSNTTSRSASVAFINQVFAFMSGALAITGVTAYLFGTNLNLLSLLINPETGSHTILGWVVMLSPIIFVFAFGAMFQRARANTLLLAFALYAVLMGMSMSYIFIVYTQQAISTTFFITSGTFAVMAFVGYTTKTDLTRFGSLLMMALVGIIIASLVNWFIGSANLQYIISILGVLIFTGLIAYDTQKLKHIGAEIGTGTEESTKVAIWGALSLYLNFVNLFMFLLQLFGGRNND